VFLLAFRQSTCFIDLDPQPDLIKHKQVMTQALYIYSLDIFLTSNFLAASPTSAIPGDPHCSQIGFPSLGESALGWGVG